MAQPPQGLRGWPRQVRHWLVREKRNLTALGFAAIANLLVLQLSAASALDGEGCPQGWPELEECECTECYMHCHEEESTWFRFDYDACCEDPQDPGSEYCVWRGTMNPELNCDGEPVGPCGDPH